MPRRPSVPLAQLQSSSSYPVQPRNTRSAESSAVLLSPPPMTPQPPPLPSMNMEINGNRYQKVVTALTNRLKNQLPCNSGYTLDAVESDEIVQEAISALIELPNEALPVITWSLVTILEGLSSKRPATSDPLAVLQSQLFILKVLAVNLAARLSFGYRTQAQASSASLPLTSPTFDSSFSRRRQASAERSDISSWPTDVPPLDEPCARYVLSCIVNFLRHSINDAPLVLPSKTSDITFRDFEIAETPDVLYQEEQTTKETLVEGSEPTLRAQSSRRSILSARMSINSTLRIPNAQKKYQKTHMSLVKSSTAVSALISEFAGRIVFYISITNWSTVFDKLRNKIRVLANRPEDSTDLLDLQLLAHIILDRSRLVQVLGELSSLLVNMAREAQIAIAIPLRSAVWNWIEYFSAEFNEIVRARSRTEGTPERVFDLLFAKMKSGDERLVWPTLSALSCVTSERIAKDHLRYGSTFKSGRKDLKFFDDLLNQTSGGGRNAEIALAASIDICRGAMFASCADNEEVPIRLLAVDVAHEIKSALNSITMRNSNRQNVWEQEEIDVVLYANALVAVYRFLPPDETVQLFQNWMEASCSDAVKICVIRACLTLKQEAPRFPSQRSHAPLYEALGQRCRDVFKTSGHRRPELDHRGTMKRSDAYPKAKRAVTEALSDRELLMLGILSLWRADAAFQTTAVSLSDLQEWVSLAVNIWDANVDSSVKVSTTMCLCRFTMETFHHSPMDPGFKHMTQLTKQALPATLLSVSVHLLRAREDVEAQRMWVNLALQVLDLYLMKIDAPHVKETQIDPDRAPAFILAEVAFTVTLTSPVSFISQMAMKGLRHLAMATRQANAPPINLISDDDYAKRIRVYDQLGDPKVAVVGRVGHQKRVRKHLRLLAPCHAVDAMVWSECYKRWRVLMEPVLDLVKDRRIGAPNWKSQEMKFQWHNLTLFLAAFGGICLEKTKETRNQLVAMFPEKSVPDELLLMEDLYPFLGPFLTDLIKVLVISDVATRDTARDALGAELHLRLYPRILKYLEETTRSYASYESSQLPPEYLLFLDQFIAILKLILENERLNLEEKMTFDVSNILSSLTHMIARCTGSQTFRLRMKFCQLCENICSRTDTFILRKESSARQNVVELVMEWIEDNITDAGKDSLIDDFNTACLKTFVKLLDKFQLRLTDALNAGDDTIHVISRHFNKYSYTLLNYLEMYQPPVHNIADVDKPEFMSVERIGVQREIEIRELVITGLSNLVSANSEIGFKQCLPLAYDQDKRKKAIFAQVFARVITQGTTFNEERSVAAQSRNTRLIELVRGSKLTLALTIVKVCPVHDENIMISVLLNIFDNRASLMTFLKALVDGELERTESETSLFRPNSVGNKFLAAFAKIHGYTYLRNLINPLITLMKELPPGFSFEMNPIRVNPQDIAENQKTVEYVAARFLNLLVSSLPQLPPMVREVSAYISTSIAKRWKNSKFAVMGAFLFLRFITPAVVAPENIDIELPLENRAAMRRGLMVVGKILQNLGNNIFFGKEAYMTVLNSFLEGQIANVTRFLSEIHRSTPVVLAIDDPWQGTISDDTDAIVLHRFLDRHADKIGKELLSRSRPVVDGDTSGLNGKRVWDELCALLVDLGTPVDVPQLSNCTSTESQVYLDLMVRFADVSTAPVEKFFVETRFDDSGIVVFVLKFTQLNVEMIDIELLLYYILKLLSEPRYQNESFDIVIDCTAFTPMSELPLQWLRFCAEVVPCDIRERFITAHILNPNSLAQRYLRRLYNFMAGTLFSSSVKTYVSVAQLIEQLPASVADVLEDARELEQEPFEEYQDVIWKQSNSMRVPVVLRVAASHIKITSTQRQPVSPALACRNVEIINLADIADVYNVFTGQDQNEFIVRRRQGITLYFSSLLRDPISKTIRHAKGKLKDAQILMTARFSRFSNVAATLLHVGFMSVDPDDEILRAAAYHLLGAVCVYLKYDKSPIIASRAGLIPGDTLTFVNQLSEKLADFAPQLTLDFIHEVSASMKTMGKDSTGLRVTCLSYLSPWIKNLAYFVNPTHPLYERSGARLRDCIMTLAEMSIAFPEISPTLQKCVWSEVSKSDTAIVDTVLQELLSTASDGGITNNRCETIAHIVATLASINVRGRIYYKLRMALNRPPAYLVNHVSELSNYNEISTLIKFCYVIGSQSRALTQNQLYVPELIHLVMLVAADGPIQVRKCVYGIVLNMLQSLYVSRTEDMPGTELLEVLTDFTSTETLRLFGLSRSVTASGYTIWNPHNDREYLHNLGNLASFLTNVMEITAGSRGLLNIWRARWMSLVTSIAFQNIPATQTRSFIALAALANQDVDDDYLYQILVSFASALGQANENHVNTVISMLQCMGRIIPILNKNSRYIHSMFWLAVCLLQSSYSAYFIEAATLLRVTIEAMDEQDVFKDASVSAILLESRVPLEEITSQLDDLLKISFETSFSFSLAAIIFKGMRLRHFKEHAEAALRTLLRVTARSEREDSDASNGFKDKPSPECLGYFLALMPVSTSSECYRNLLEDCQIGDAWHAEAGLSEEDPQGVPKITQAFLGVEDSTTALLAATFIGSILSTAQGDDTETEMLYGLLADLAVAYPETVSLVFAGLHDKIISAFMSSSNPAIIRHVSSIFRNAQPELPLSGQTQTSTSTVNTMDEAATMALYQALDEHRMQGLANSFQFLPPQNGYATKMINWIPTLVQLMI